MGVFKCSKRITDCFKHRGEKGEPCWEARVRAGLCKQHLRSRDTAFISCHPYWAGLGDATALESPMFL